MGRFQIRKTLDDPGVQGSRDMSGFVFEVSRPSTAVGQAADPIGTFTTDAAGRTPEIVGLVGEFRVAEVGRPSWAAGLIDTGPITFHLASGTRGDPSAIALVEFAYTNVVPPGSLSTRAFDRSDGDQFVWLPPPELVAETVDAAAEAMATAEVVDEVAYCGLVPGTPYTLSGSVNVLGAGATTTPSGVAGSTTFAPSEPCGVVEVIFAVPADSSLRGRVGVVFEVLTLGSTGQLVARHADPSSVSQTLHFPAVATVMARDGDGQTRGDDGHTSNPAAADQVITPGDGVVDTVLLTGLAPDRQYRAVLTLFERLDDGTCVATDLTASRDFIGAALTVNADGSPTPHVVDVAVTVPGPGLFVGFERIFVVDSVDGVDQLRLVAVHEDCDALSQTIRSVAPPPPPPPPPPPTSTTSTRSTSSTSTAPEAPPTTVPAPVMPPPSSTVPEPARPLPRTGSSPVGIATTAALLATCGLGAIVISRRRW